ncbi:hypothetical protein H1P_80040 [Hyella patelloides LEGE 07179]|uniref:Filamentous haemagglutinin FhaB/tRNA nuclease CdiA-like TPS domain-containing protein n=1 Tax=Hyella patelloides LEGE 07179 TaxID=945734 RepID=A0A563W492_9CYAN|nr:filamentous hemagglutinin N-terminal domain-containing protein [Hyella patelloides]VEP18485.1 hypothetical protein H1P_80040 [Hyella patelloides LEGE 07179]
MNEPVSSSINPDGTLTGGTREGANLFYNFTEFSVPTNEEVFITDTEDVNNIFIKVTGDSLTEINGFIKTENDTNLFLINPAGILFELGASLDIDGDFVASTADSILFPDDISFNANDNESQTLLSSEIPIGLSFGDNPTAIEVNLNSSLNSDEDAEFFGDNLALIGGDINISDSKLSSEAITLSALSDSGIVNIEEGNLSFPEEIAKGDINITANSQLTVTGDDGGSFELDAQNFTLDEASSIIGGVNNDLNLRVDDLLLVDSGSSIASDGGNLNVFTGNLTLRNTGVIISNSVGEGEGEVGGGNIEITASEALTIDNSKLIPSNNEGVDITQIFSDGNGEIGEGAGGSITIDVSNIRVSTSIYRLQNSNTPGSYIYVGTEEKNTILDNFPNFINEGVAFNAAISPGDDLIPLYRFQSQIVSGTYVFVGESERVNINENFAESFIEEGLAFYVYSASSGLGTEFSRFQNSDLPGTYLFTTGEERENIRANLPNFIEEGLAFEAL